MAYIRETLYDFCMRNEDKKYLLKEWDYEKNEIRPDEVTRGSDKKIWWRCEKGHFFEQLVSSRTIGNQGCPICSGKKVLKGYNDLCTTHPYLIKEWDFDKNEITPDKVSKGSHKKVWWKCSKGHSFEQGINARTINNKGCPYCSNNMVLRGFNDFETWCLKNNKVYLLEEWDYEKNIVKPYEMLNGSKKKVWWKCVKGHEWESSIVSRTTENNKCPICSNKKVLGNFNDFETWCIKNNKIYLLEEWDYEKNTIKPNEVVSGSKKKVWWKCRSGHAWSTSIRHRTINGSGCPHCFNERQTSFAEQVVYYYVKQSFPDAINSYVLNQKFKIDIFIPSLNLGIEYDGYAWHQDLETDKHKNIICKDNGIYLIRIREDGCPKMSENNYLKIIPCNCIDIKKHIFDVGNSTFQLLNMLERMINKKILINIDIERDKNKIYSMYKQNKYEKSLEYLRPDLMEEWDYELNKDIDPSMFTLGSGLKVHWVCPLGHKYMATIQYRALRGTKCPYCNGKKVLVGFNDFATIHKDLLKYWDYEKNTFYPTEITKCSNKKIWFKKNGKSYYTTIDNFIRYL